MNFDAQLPSLVLLFLVALDLSGSLHLLKPVSKLQQHECTLHKRTHHWETEHVGHWTTCWLQAWVELQLLKWKKSLYWEYLPDQQTWKQVTSQIHQHWRTRWNNLHVETTCTWSWDKPFCTVPRLKVHLHYKFHFVLSFPK